MADRHEWRARLMRELGDTIWDDPDLIALPQADQDKIENLADEFGRAVCAVVGHQPTQDHCGIPDHDHCLWCQARTPGQAERASATSLSPGGEL